MPERLQQTDHEPSSALSDHFIITVTNEVIFKPPTDSKLDLTTALLIEKGLTCADSISMLQAIQAIESSTDLPQAIAETLAEFGSDLQQIRIQLLENGIDLDNYVKEREELRALLQDGIMPSFSANE